jgi:hypothetical protein
MRPRLFSAFTLIVMSFLTAVAGAQKAGDNRTLEHPDGDLLYYLYCQRANMKVPYETFAEREPAYRQADEFNRDRVRSEIVARLKSSAPDVRGVRYVTLRANGSFGTYDFKHQEFDFELENSMDLSYIAHEGGANILVRLTNGGAASIWSMPPERGKALLGQLHGERRVLLDLRTEVLGAEDMGYDPNRTDIRGRLNVKILEIDVYTPDGTTLLDQLKVDAPLPKT